jgi:hypothetical protein
MIFRSATTVFTQGKFSYMNAATPASMITWPVRGNGSDPPAVVSVPDIKNHTGLFDLHCSTSNNHHTITSNIVTLELINYLGR